MESCIALLGTFDGVHHGHRELFRRAREQGGRLCAVVIDREVVGITDIPYRERLLRAAGADRVVILPLSRVRDMSPREFVDYLRSEQGITSAVCGYDFRFGRDRSGDTHTLSAMIPTVVVPEYKIDGMTVSSGAIRAALAAGEIEQASRLMGRAHRIVGMVEDGKGLGHKRGYPTANIPYDLCPVKHGVYFTRVRVRERVYNAITNIGVCPTVPARGIMAESYLLDFSERLYGMEIEVELLRFHREERRFPDVDSLYAQIAADERAARECFKVY